MSDSLRDERIDVTRRELADKKAALEQASRKPENRADVAILEGTVRRIERGLTELDRLAVRMQPDWPPTGNELRKQYDDLVDQTRKASSEVDAGLARLGSESDKARDEQPEVLNASLRRGKAMARNSAAYRLEPNIGERGRELGHVWRMRWAALLTGALVLLLFTILRLVLAGK